MHQLLWLTAKLSAPIGQLSAGLFRSRSTVRRFVRWALVPGPADDFDEIVTEVLEETARAGAGASDWQNHSIGPLRMRVDLRPRLGEIRCPVLLIQGTEDIGVRAHHTAAAARAVPGARCVFVDGAGHWVNRQEPDLVNRLVREFLD